MSETRHIARAAGIIGGATFSSRILGFVRDCIIARLFGTAQSAQAFVMAWTIPNMLRDLVGEGAANAAFVPVLSEHKTRLGKEEFWQLFNVLLNIIMVVLALLSILGVLAAPLIIRIIAPGFMAHPEKLKETVTLARIMFPYVLLIGLAAYGTGVLNSLKHFSAPALGPCLMNIAMIAIPLIFSPRMRHPSLALAFSVLAGGILQLSIQIPVLYKKGARYKKQFDLTHPAVRQIGRLLLPRAVASSVYQLNIVVNRVCSSLVNIVGEGAPAALYYANRLFQFPLAIFGIALAQAALPTLSEQAQEPTLFKFKDTVSFSLRLIFFISFPAAVGLAILRVPIIQLLFQHGRFDIYSTRITAVAVLFYSLGLVFYAGNNILTSSFYSLKDTRTPLKIALKALVFNIILNVSLMRPLKVGGLALATALSGALSFILLFVFLRKKIGSFQERRIAGDFFKIFAASVLMGIVVFVLREKLCYYLQSGSIPARSFYLAAILIAAAAVYFTAAFIFKLEQINIFIRWISKRR